MHTHIKFPQGFREIAPNVFCFLLSPIQRGLSDTYHALTATTFDTTDMDWGAGAYTYEKFPNFCVGVLQDKKMPPEAVFWVECLLLAYSSNGTILSDRNHFRH